MHLPTELADFVFPEHDWEQALAAAESENDERPTWAYNWPAGMRLLHELNKLINLKDKKICDLGCGRGLLGFGAISYGAKAVSFCDASTHVLQYVDACLQANEITNAHSIEHRWGDPIPNAPYDVILGGDILYRPEYFNEILTSIANSLGHNGVALLSDPREKLEEELSALAMAHKLVMSTQRRETYTLIKFRCEKQ